MDFAPEPFAGEAVGEFMQRGGAKDRDPKEEQAFDTIQTAEVTRNLGAVDDAEAQREEHQGGGAHHEGRGEAEPHLVNEPIQQAIRVIRLPSQGKDIAPQGSVPVHSAWAVRRLEEAEPMKVIEEGPQGFCRDSHAELPFGASRDHLERGAPVKLASNEMFRLAELVEAVIARIFDDKDALFGRTLLAETQIVTELWEGRGKIHMPLAQRDSGLFAGHLMPVVVARGLCLGLIERWRMGAPARRRPARAAYLFWPGG